MCRDVVMVGANMTDAPQRMEQPPGNVQAFDVRTGKPRWTFRVIPRPGEVGAETWKNDSWAYSGQANVWSLMTADQNLGLAYLPLTSATNDMYGGHRLGDNLFANSLVCVRCETGERVWHYQRTADPQVLTVSNGARRLLKRDPGESTPCRADYP